MVPALARALWPAMVGALAVAYASIGDGAWTRRSAIAWMMGSWGARLAVQGLYTRSVRRAGAVRDDEGATDQLRKSGVGQPELGAKAEEMRDDEHAPVSEVPEARRRVRGVLLLVVSAIVCSMPALLAAFNRTPQLSSIELAACGIWLVGFTLETTADRQRLRFVADPANEGLPCRAGLWRSSRHADRVFTVMVWVAFAMFGIAAIW